MTTKKTQTTQTTETKPAAAKPDWVVKTPHNSKLVRIGAAWNRPADGGICLRLSGDVLVTSDLYLFPNTPYEQTGAR
jgi:hypothetical protein